MIKVKRAVVYLNLHYGVAEKMLIILTLNKCKS